MQFLINECSFIGQAKDSFEADELIGHLYDLIKEIEPIKGDNPIKTYSNFSNQKLDHNLTIYQWLSQTLKSQDRNKEQLLSFLYKLLIRGRL